MLHRKVWKILTDVSEKLTASIIGVTLMMEAESSFETSVNIYQTTRYISEDSHIHIRRHKNHKSHKSVRLIS
jgi:hypothetical protein